MPRRVVAALAVLTLALLLAGPAAARQETKRFHWERYDVAIDLRSDGGFRVCERQAVMFTLGSFSTSARAIPLGRVEGITDIQISEDGQPYQPGDGRQAGTVHLTWEGGGRAGEGGNLIVNWAFPPTTGRVRAFDLCYTINGGLRVTDDGPLLLWKAVPGDRPFEIAASTITVNLPAPAEGLAPSASGPPTRATLVDDRTVRYEAGPVDANQEIEVGLPLPAGLVTATKQPWQEQEERARAAAAQAAADQARRDSAILPVIGLALLILAGGAIGAVILRRQLARAPRSPRRPSILREPPDDLSPAAVGLLAHTGLHTWQVTGRETLATLVSLGGRGVTRLKRIDSRGKGRPDILLTRLPSSAPLARHERTLLHGIFASGDTARLSERIGRVDRDRLTRQIYDEAVRRGYLHNNPFGWPNRYQIAGSSLGVAGSIAGLIAGWLLAGPIGAIALALASGAAGALLFFGVGQWLPLYTPAYRQKWQRWEAFRRYLERIKDREPLDQAGEIFARYLPYAIAFGIERAWVNAFASANVATPDWFAIEARPPRGRHKRLDPARPPARNRDPDPDSRAAAAEIGWPGGETPSTATAAGSHGAQSASDQLFTGLQGISDGLSALLDSAGQVLAVPSPSRPAPEPSRAASAGGGRRDWGDSSGAHGPASGNSSGTGGGGGGGSSRFD